MLGMETNYCQILGKSLRDERAVDESTFASLEVLKERLDRVKGLGGSFAGIEFSQSVRNLEGQRSRVAVG
jgi:hypothetical protein